MAVSTLASNPVHLAFTTITIRGTEGDPTPYPIWLPVTNTGPATTIAVGSETPWITPGLTLPIAAGATILVTCTASAENLLQGTHLGSLDLSVPGYEPLQLLITYEVGPPMASITPASLSFSVEAGQTATANVTINTTAPLPVNSLVSGSGILVIPPLLHAREGTVQIKLDSRALTIGQHHAEVAFADVKGRTILRLPISITVTEVSWIETAPGSIDFRVESASAPVQSASALVINHGPATTFQASSNRSWLSVTSASGALAANGSASLNIYADPSSLTTGAYGGAIEITAPGRAPSLVLVSLVTIVVPPVTLTPSALSLSANEGSTTPVSGSLILDGSGVYVIFEVSTDQAWLTVSPSNGVAPSTSALSLRVSANPQGLAVGIHHGKVTVKHGADKAVYSNVSFTVNKVAALVVSPTSIEFNGLGSSQPARRVVSVTTQSGAAAQFTFTHQSPGNWLIAEQSGGQLSVGVNPLLLPSSPSTGTIQISPVPSDDRTYTVQITARKASTPASWAMPQVADGGDFTTSVTLVNPAASAATATLRFHRNRQDGSYSTEDWTPATAGGQSLDAIRIPAKSVVTIETLGTEEATSSGWVEVTGPSELGGFAVFRQTGSTGNVQEATVPMSAGGSARVVLPYDNISGWVTSFAAINRDLSAPLAINYDLRDSDGRSLGSGPLIVLPSAGHLAARLIDIFPSSNGKRGSLVLTSSRDAISALALRFSPQGAFTSLETTPDSSSGAAVRQVFAQIADGGGFNTLLTLQNNNAAAVTATLRFRRAVPGSNGATEPWQPALEGSASTANIVIPAGGAYAVRTAGIGDTPTSGWAEVESVSPLSGSAVFSFKPGQAIPQEASVALKAGQPAGFLLPFDNTLGFVTSVALANIDAAAAARVSVVLRDESGATLGEETIDIPASGHLAFETVNRLAATAGKRGSAEFTIQSGWVAAIGLRFSPAGPFTSYQPQYW